jgi:hypothetical protein
MRNRRSPGEPDDCLPGLQPNNASIRRGSMRTSLRKADVSTALRGVGQEEYLQSTSERSRGISISLTPIEHTRAIPPDPR